MAANLRMGQMEWDELEWKQLDVENEVDSQKE